MVCRIKNFDHILRYAKSVQDSIKMLSKCYIRHIAEWKFLIVPKFDAEGKNLPNAKLRQNLKQNLKIWLYSNCLQHFSRINWELIILLYGEFYDAELNSARILHVAELSLSRSACSCSCLRPRILSMVATPSNIPPLVPCWRRYQETRSGKSDTLSTMDNGEGPVKPQNPATVKDRGKGRGTYHTQ